MWGRCLFAGAAALQPAAASAGDLPRIALIAGLGYHELKPEEALGADADAVAISTDLTGDGNPDEIRILLNAERDDGLVVVVSVTRKIDTYVLTRVGHDVAKGMRVYLTEVDGRAALLTVQPNGRRSIDQFDGEKFHAVAEARTS